jgi:hypothetical protein
MPLGHLSVNAIMINRQIIEFLALCSCRTGFATPSVTFHLYNVTDGVANPVQHNLYAGRGLQPRPQRSAGRGLQPRPQRFISAGRGLQPRPQRSAGRGLQPRPQRFISKTLRTGIST